MSIDSTEEVTSSSLPSERNSESSSESGDWETLRQQFLSDAKQGEAKQIFGEAAKRGAVYRWGVAVAQGGPCDELTDLLSRLACGQRKGKSKHASVDLTSASDLFVERMDRASSYSTLDAANIVLWSSALPALSDQLDQSRWWRVLSAIQQARESILQRSRAYATTHLIMGGELGLTLAWRLGDLPSCQHLQASSLDAIAQWCNGDEESIQAAIAQGTDARLVLASLIRCRRLLQQVTKGKLRKKQVQIGAELATWIAAMTTHTGGSALSTACRKDVADDLPPHGLLAHAVEFDSESLAPAVAASLGAAQSGGRLTWEVDLPETMHHDPDAKLAMMFPDWDVRRGRTHIDYSGEEVRLEVFAGRTQVVSGPWQTMIEVDGQEQQPCDEWINACDFSDDDVHYVEIEQAWTAGILLQRQMMLLREDRCLLLADAVVPSNRLESDSRSISYVSRLPLSPSIGIDAEPETREVFLTDGRRRGLVFPLSAAEWRVGPTNATLKETEDRHLLLSTQGRARLYAPLWFDFQHRRFKRKRTWRQLTIADQLRIARRDEAVGYRVQVGSEQWMMYRSLAGGCCRSLLGKHLIADFFASRFDPSDGSHDALVTVDDNDSLDV